MIYIALISLFLLMNYIVLYAILFLNSSKQKKQNSNSKFKKISVVIPFRNEAQNIPNLIHSLNQLSYPLKLWEVIFVDDSSEDHSNEILETSLKEVPFQYRILSLSDKFGKKEALKAGFSAAQGEIIIQSDADCQFSSEWLQTHSNAFTSENIKLVCGAVMFNPSKNIFEHLQQAEIMALMTTSKMTIEAGKPLMCNAANMSFCKSILPLVLDTFNQTKHPSGDDVFLLHQISSKYGSKAIAYLTEKKSLVLTNPLSSLHDFLMQRSRWASKTKTYSSFFAQFFAALVFLANMAFCFAFVYLIFFCKELCIIFLTAILSKFLIDILTVLSFRKTYKIKKPKYQFSTLILLELLYPFYLISVLIFSILKPAIWKGREIQ